MTMIKVLSTKPKHRLKIIPKSHISFYVMKLAEQEGRKWPQFLAAGSACIACFASGLHTGWPAPSIPKLLSDDYAPEISNDEASYITIIGPFGNVFGGFIGMTLLDKIGRKKPLLLIAVPQMIAFTMIYFSSSTVILLYLARFIGGIAEGATFSTMPVYISEIASPKIRGTLGTLIILSCITALVFVNLIGSYLSIETTAGIFLIFPIIFLVTFWRMPESPYYLLMKNRKNDAEESLKFLRRKTDVSDELKILCSDVNRQMTESGNYKDIFTIDSNRKAFLLVVGARIVQQFTGVSPFTLYIQVLIKDATDAIPPVFGSTILLLVQFVMGILSTFFVDRWGRKPLLIFSTLGCTINLLIQSIYFTLKEHTSINLTAIDWLPLLMMITFIILFSIGLGVVVSIIASEMFSTSIKTKALCLINVVFALSMMGTTKFYQSTADQFGLTVPFYTFTLCTFLGLLFCYFFLPETKGKSLEEIQQQLKSSINKTNY